MTGKKSAILEEIGIEAICEMVIDGDSYTAIAKKAGVSKALLSIWIAKDPERAALAHEARAFSARTFDDKAETVLLEAQTPFELQAAKELAHHYRWRASKISPEYSDKLQIDQKTTLTDLTDEQLDAKLAQLFGSNQVTEAADPGDPTREGDSQG